MLDGSILLLTVSVVADYIAHMTAAKGESIVHNALRDVKSVFLATRAYRRKHGRFPRIIRPRTFTEKVLWRMLFDRRELLRTAADKFAARQYALERLGPEFLPDLYFVTDQPEAIPFDSLPDKFVIKPTHASGLVNLVPDKRLADYTSIIDQCRTWLRANYFYSVREWAYRTVPRRILIEEFLGDESGDPPMDFKFFVFGGRVRMIQVHASRFTNHQILLLDPDWRRLEVRFTQYPPIESEVPPPKRLADMIDAAQRLGRGIDFVRADFYDLGERMVFGELTMTPGAALGRFIPSSFDYELGRYWRLPRRFAAGAN